MKRYAVTEKRVVFVHYIVPAETEKQAKMKVLAGEADEYVDDSEIYDWAVVTVEEFE